MKFPTTAQEVFDRVWHRSVTLQIPPSIVWNEATERPQCKYRPDDGDFSKGCHVGIFLTPEIYRPSFEGHGIGYLAHHLPGFSAELSEFVHSYYALLTALQGAHDRVATALFSDTHAVSQEAFLRQIQSALLCVAEMHGLNCPDHPPIPQKEEKDVSA